MDPITAVLTLKPGRDKAARNRHPWIFSGSIERYDGDPKPGDLVHVSDAHDRFLATAFYNPHSQIRARILSWRVDEAVDAAFWRSRIQRAIAARAALNLPPHTTAYRLIFSEADGLPGLIVDRYGDYLVMQCLTLGIDQRKDEIAAHLIDCCQPRGIIERSDANARSKEGLPPAAGLLWGEMPPPDFTVRENGLSFGVDLLGGHKTGLYLDQRDNRTAVSQPALVAGKTVLNVFAYTGGFGLYAVANGARRVTHIDSSIPALEMAEANALHNGWERPSDVYLAGDAFEVLRAYRDQQQQFDLIVLDPPKFVHTQRDLKRATRGYKDLNWLALRLLRPGGALATFSCSGLVSADLFQKILFGAAVDAERDVQIMQRLNQPADHPVLLTFPESAYLTGLLCRVW